MSGLPGVLSKQLGPFPVGGWVGILAAGAGVAYLGTRKRTPARGSLTQNGASVQPVSFDQSGLGGTSTGGMELGPVGDEPKWTDVFDAYRAGFTDNQAAMTGVLPGSSPPEAVVAPSLGGTTEVLPPAVVPPRETVVSLPVAPQPAPAPIIPQPVAAPPPLPVAPPRSRPNTARPWKRPRPVSDAPPAPRQYVPAPAVPSRTPYAPSIPAAMAQVGGGVAQAARTTVGSQRAFGTFDKNSQAKLRGGGTVVGGDGRVFKMIIDPRTGTPHATSIGMLGQVI